MPSYTPRMNTFPPVGAHLIAGDWVTEGAAGTGVSLNPARPDEPVGDYPIGDAGTASDAVGAAVEAQTSWRSLPFGARARILEQAARLFDERADDLALLCTLEEGKTLAESHGEATLAAETFRYQAAIAKMSSERIFPNNVPGETIRTVRVPLGVVGVVTPWNFPLLIPVWKLAPALAAGNTVVWKPASDTPLLSVAIARLLTDAGLPDGVLNLVLGPGSMGAAMVADERVDGVTFTGSVPVGQRIRDVVTARNGRVQLELGGHNPCIVFPDADLDMAVTAVVGGAMGATGQKCTATRRIIAVGDVHDELVDRLAVAVTALKVGDGQDPATAIGPLVSAGARTEVVEAIDQARAEGAETVAITEGVPDGPCYQAPTLFVGGTDLTITREEVFGPVSTVLHVDTEDEAFALANDTEFGLASSVFTSNLQRAHHFAEHIQSGMVWVNDWNLRDLRVPFGGMKQSGVGREGGEYSFKFFSQDRNVCVRYNYE